MSVRYASPLVTPTSAAAESDEQIIHALVQRWFAEEQIPEIPWESLTPVGQEAVKRLLQDATGPDGSPSLEFLGRAPRASWWMGP